ncbi:MAG: alpha-hydroxy-acid oxidizing protein, partial [Bdellovibrionota bacterium]
MKSVGSIKEALMSQQEQFLRAGELAIRETLLRKDEHLEVCLTTDVSSGTAAGWDAIRLPHRALPDANCDLIDVSTEFLGLPLKAPFLISSMTGGTPRGEGVNLSLARLAEERGIAMGVGSQRV